VGLARVSCHCSVVRLTGCVGERSFVESGTHRFVDVQSRQRSVLGGVGDSVASHSVPVGSVAIASGPSVGG
jgi:hypothetical protein